MINADPQDLMQSPYQPPSVLESQKVQENLYKKFQKFMTHQRQQNLYERLRNFYGKNYAIKYRPQYNFKQQWQGEAQFERSTQRNLLEQNGAEYFLYSLVFMLVNIVAIWTMSVQRYFGTKIISNGSGVYQLLISFTLLDIILNVYYQGKLKQSYRFGLWREIRTHLKHLMICGYLVWLILCDTKGDIYYLIEILVMGMMYKKAADIYQCIKVTQFSLKYQSQIKILDLLFNVFIQAHVFAIILFSASKINPDKNWIDVANLTNQTAISKYIYSFYFACTTMLTIGYGDITPRCAEEIVVTVMIEIVAVVSFGYLLNEMGHTLSKMREQSEELQRDLQTISKMSKYYNLERSLQNKAKAFLFSNQVKGEELKVEDEKRVLMKLNEQLRQEIHHENSLTVIKSCVFFLCHWSKALQSEVARRLEKRIFAPNERLVPAAAPARLFIIKHGRVDVFMTRFTGPHERQGCSQDRRKLLKVIASAGREQVSDNIYGYTGVFSNRPARLQAITAEFTSTYSVGAEEFLSAVQRNAHDFEYFHQVKSRIDQSVFSQQWEAPSINNIREHYAPSRIVIIKKYRRRIQRPYNHRKNGIRRQRANKINLLLPFAIRAFQQNSGIDQTLIFTVRRFKSAKQQEFRSASEQYFDRTDSYQDVNIEEEEEDSIKKSYQQALAILKTRGSTKAFDQNANKQLIAHNFELHKQFFNFFKKSNISLVLRSFEKENFMQKNAGNGISSLANEYPKTRNLVASVPN